MTIQILKRSALLVGAVLLSSSTLALAQAGSLDPTFGKGGIVTTTFGGENTTVLNAAAIQSDGKILAAGLIPSGGTPEPGLARYNTDGSLDSTFGTGGIVTTKKTGAILGLALLSDGKILAGAAGFIAVEAFRYNTNGTLDTTFGTNGVASVRAFSPTAFDASFGGIAVQTDGKILVAAGSALVRFLANGQVDSTFGTGGVVPLVFNAGAITLPSHPGPESLAKSTARESPHQLPECAQANINASR